jgi:HD-GYP domain-containing protein (c-di-GMP phosphodiesterase class II)
VPRIEQEPLVVPTNGGRFRRSAVPADGAAETARTLLLALDEHDPATRDHSESVVTLGLCVARFLEFPHEDLETVARVAELHDIGKVGIPESILHKPAALSEEEWAVIQKHTSIGAAIVRAIPALAHLAPAIRAAHERWDGRGYPDGLLGEVIPLASRVVFTCDAYDAMTSDRPYRRAWTPERAKEEILAGAGRQFDPAVAWALLAALEA